MTDISAQLQELLDRQAIRDCVYRYARGLDRYDADLVETCYHADAIDDHGSYVGSGRGLADSVIARQKDLLGMQHHMTNHVVELEGDSAHGETYFIAIKRDPSGITEVINGRYVDRFERRNKEWRIAVRVCMIESGIRVPTIDMERLDRMYTPRRKDRSDISYERRLKIARKSAEEPHPAV